MVADLAVLQNKEQELSKTLSNKLNLPVKQRQLLDRELGSLRDRIANLEAFEKLTVGCWVSKGNSDLIGKVTEKTPGNQPTVFVSWRETIPVPEQPRLLELDEIANSGIAKIGDIVWVAKKKNDKNVGYRLDKISQLQARGWIEVSDESRFCRSEWYPAKDFDRWDFDWLVGATVGSCDADTEINVKASLARANKNTLVLALQWIRQHCAENKQMIEALKQRLRQSENELDQRSPLEYLRDLSVPVEPPIAATKVNASATNKLLNMLVAAATVTEFEAAEYLIKDAQEYAASLGLKLEVANSWLITPTCKSEEEALALCPQRGDRISKGDKFGSIAEYVFTDSSLQATVMWDNGTTTEESGFTLETLPPLFEYLHHAQESVGEENVLAVESNPNLENPDTLDVSLGSDNTVAERPEESKPLLPLGFQEVSVADLRSHPINSKIYGEEEDDTALEEMIGASGWIKPLLVTPNGDVVGGNRRLRTAKKKNIERLTVEVREFPDEESILEALLLDNAVREKTVEQKVREARFWLPIESYKARSRKGSSSENQENFPGGDKGQVRDIVSNRVGLGSGKNFQKADKVLTVIESLQDSEPENAHTLRELLNKKSVHAAYTAACWLIQDAEAKQRTQAWKPTPGERIKVSQRASHHAEALGAVVSVEKSIAIIRFDETSEGKESDNVYLCDLLPADPEAAKLKLEQMQNSQKPGRKYGLSKTYNGGLLPEAERNEGFDPNEEASSTLQTSNEEPRPSNVIQLRSESSELRSELPESNTGESSTSVAMEIAKGMRYLSPKELVSAIKWACEDKTNPLTDEHLDALMKVTMDVWNARHPERLEAN
ncbi:MAG: ParB/RepB/Spo0J family partition protein [Nostoc sp. SerVER01]|nr:ParB/RepB/Spo0J family partition protein [Nostoc sp. SerVER01]